ncbi:uncharacterized protein Tco025E_06764 [Trypanosoma conorhini]|uniref:Uncharacterized protein n=1 Tax=Trypanosoma conorhini TaxID=83891 RepID=A0A3R7NRV8_9TRYP|nr:uncharacterized protein Tco025E_06764 [Trypanosoma conorhini]RNF10656.1 hypothetical protein Tco025E_06764 [Trypanosoma conorhini]
MSAGGGSRKMADNARAIAYFWDALLHAVAPAPNAAKQRRRRARKSVFCCSNSNDRPAKFWFCRPPQPPRKPPALAVQQQKRKRVHFSDDVEVILIDRRNQSIL